MPEFLLSLLLTITVLTGAAGLLKTEWERTRCAYLTFEAAHARLTGARERAWISSADVRVETDSRGVRATGVCGRARERVELPWLDPPEEQP